jgi:hypothetical protein
MGETESAGEFRKKIATARIVSWVVLVSLVLELAFIEIVRSRIKPFAGFGSILNRDLLRYFFFAAAALAVVLNRVINGLLLKKRREERESVRVRRLFVASILALAMAEIPGLIGLYLFILAGLDRDSCVLIFVSLVLVFIYFPRAGNWEAYIGGAIQTCRL